jgi:hypothetical protein
LGVLVFCYGFTAAFLDMLNPSTIWSMASSEETFDFFSVFWIKIEGCTVFAVGLCIVGGIDLFVGRPKTGQTIRKRAHSGIRRRVKRFILSVGQS